MVSVIIPAYNASGTIKKAVKSVLAQTYTDFELIIVDDGSTDNTYTFCQSLSNTNERIRVIHQENKGSIQARLAGIKQAEGKYIFFLDADDWISPDALEKLLAASNNQTADVVVAHGYSVAKRLHFIKWEFRCFHRKPGIITALMLQPYHKVYIPYIYTNNICGRLYRKELFDDITVPDFKALNIHYGEDRYINFLISPKIKTISLLDEHLYYYRHGGSVASYNSRLWTDYIQLFNFQIEYAKTYNPSYINFMIGQRDRVFNQHVVNMIFAKIPDNEILNFIMGNIQCDMIGAKQILTQIKISITPFTKVKKWILHFI